MPSTFHKFTGYSDYAFLKNPNRFDKYSINLFCDKPTRAAIKALGIRGSFKEPREGSPAEGLADGLFYTFRRETKRTWRGKETVLEPPYVRDESGEPIDEILGTGSKVTVEIEVYEFPGGTVNGVAYLGGKAARLLGVVVHELVPYEAPSRDDTLPQQAAAGAAPPF